MVRSIFLGCVVVFGVCLRSLAFGGEVMGLGHAGFARRLVSNPASLAMAVAGSFEEADQDPLWLEGKARAMRILGGVGEEVGGSYLEDLLSLLGHGLVRRGPTDRRWVAITFDDGPHPNTTPRILEELRRNDAKATFFVVGIMAEAYPELVRMEEAGGHLIANHTYHHVNLKKVPRRYVGPEIEACSLVVSGITGHRPQFFRPPGGDYDGFVVKAAGRLGCRVVLWTDDPGDYSPLVGDQELQRRLLRRLSNGGIVVLHDGVERTVRMLPGLLKAIRALGYQMVTLDQYLAAEDRVLAGSAAPKLMPRNGSAGSVARPGTLD